MSNVIIGAHFNLKEFRDPEGVFYNVDSGNFNILNNVSDHIVLNIKSNGVPNKLSFSSNGIDGIGSPDTTFNLNNFYYEKQNIYFTVKYKTSNHYDFKNMPKLIIEPYHVCYTMPNIKMF